MNAIPRSAAAFVIASFAISILMSVAVLATPSARAATNLDVCGTVNVYVRPTAATAGAITIGGTPFVIAAGTTLTGDAAADVEAGAHLCFSVTLNSSGSITQLAAVKANATSTLKVCGVVGHLDDATSLSTGSISIDQTDLTLAAGADLPASVKVGTDICAKFELNGFGQVQDAEIKANGTSTVDVCGEVDGYSKATASHTGNLTIGGQDFVLALGADLPAEIKDGANLCATLELNGFGQVQDGTIDAGTTSTLTVCGKVNSYTAATATTRGELTLSGDSYSLARGADVDGRVRAEAYLKLRLTINASGRVTDVAVVRVGASVADACDGAPSTTPTPPATPGPTPITPGGPTPTPITPGGPTPNPTSTTGGPTPAPTPITPGGPTPPPTPATPGGPTPTPTASPEAPGGPTPTPPGDECGTTTSGGFVSDGNGSSAPELPATASPVMRAGQVVATAAVPSLLFAFGLLLVSALAWARRHSASGLVAQEEPLE